MHKTSVRYTNVLLTGKVRGKNVTGTIKVLKKDHYQNMCGYPYILCYEISARPILHIWLRAYSTHLVESKLKFFRLYYSWTRGLLSEMLKALLLLLLLLLKTNQKWFLCYHSKKKILISFPSFSEKCWCQHFSWDSRLIVSRKNGWLSKLFCGFQQPLQRSTFSMWS